MSTTESNPTRSVHSDRARVEQILEQILRERRPQLIAYAARCLRVRGDAEDVVQTASLNFLRFFTTDGLRDTETAARAYLYVAVNHSAQKANRTRKRRDPQGAVDAEEASRGELLTDEILRREEVGELLASLAELDPRQRQALLLRTAGYSTAEITAQTGWSERTLRKLTERGNRKLADLRS